MARRIGNLPLAEAPEQLAQSQDRARARAEAKPKAKAKVELWRPMDGPARDRRERLRTAQRLILVILVRRALLAIFPPPIVVRICSAWRP